MSEHVSPHERAVATPGDAADFETAFDTEQITEELRAGTAYLGISMGFLTRIDDETQEIVAAVGDHPMIQPGRQCPLSDSYCQRTVETDGSLAVTAASTADRIPTHAVETFALETYVGATVTVGEEFFGTVCFADSDARSDPFTESETLYVELLAERIGTALARQSHQQALAAQNERLAAEKRRFEEIAETSSDIIFRIDEAMTLTYVSDAVERLLGYDPASLIDRPFLGVTTPASATEALGLYQRVRDGESVDGVELRLEAADGSVRTFEVNARPFEASDSERCGVQGTARDITGRNERQRELERKTRAMDEADVGIVIADATREGNPLTYANDRFCTLTGYDREAVVGRDFLFHHGERTDPEAVERLRQAFEAGESATVELVTDRKSGGAFWNEVTVTPVESKDGDVVRFVGFQRDVTERKRREQLRNVMNRVLRHNLRNQMTVVLGHGVGVETQTEKQATMVRSAATDLLSVAEKAREMHRFAQADRDLERLEPAALLDVATDGVSPESDATVETVVETNRPIAGGHELRQAVRELVENAIAHDPAPETHVEVAARRVDDDIVVEVVDDGPGIDDGEQRVIETGRESPLEHGAGLDLWFVNWAVTRYGGSFQLSTRDSDETGTVATIRLPAVDPNETLAAASRRPTTLSE